MSNKTEKIYIGNGTEYGKTHYVEVDTFKPEAKSQAKPQPVDDLPF